MAGKFSNRLKGARLKLYEELRTVSMLADEGAPVVCSCCLGAGGEMGVFGKRRCGQCGGFGYDLLGPAAKSYAERQFGAKLK